ncbi:MAG: hypothetical protein LQ352_003934 [Teloschistes flavicans]|nr:MAG: hypothetical protein LQ352_003934 [Teloschistes flavicans]
MAAKQVKNHHIGQPVSRVSCFKHQRSKPSNPRNHIARIIADTLTDGGQASQESPHWPASQPSVVLQAPKMAAEAKSKPRVTLAQRASQPSSARPAVKKAQTESAQKIVKHAVKGTAEESQSPNCSSIGFPQNHEAAPPSSSEVCVQQYV